MLPPHTFVVIAGGPPTVAMGLHEAGHALDGTPSAPARRLRWRRRPLRAERPRLALSRRLASGRA